MVNEKRKIAFIVQSLELGGAQRVISTLANHLVSSYQIHVITFIKREPFYELKKDIKVISCYDNMEPSDGFIEALQSNYFLIRKINFIVKENRFDILISFMTTANVLTTLVGKVNKIPVIISERTNPYHQRIPKIWKLLRSISYRYSDMLVVQTETIKTYFDRKIKSSKIRILPNPISIELTNKRILNKVSERKNIILSVGRLVKSKAHDILIKAFAKTDYKAWELWIAGDGPEFRELLKLTTELNLSGNVKLLGLVKDMPSLYNSSKIFAFSSTYEGFPNALIEAMHFGLACVSTDCPTGPAELIKDGENGYLVPINDIDEMYIKLNLLMDNSDKIDSFSEKGMATVRPYEEENVTKKWKNIINQLIRNRNTPNIFLF